MRVHLLYHLFLFDIGLRELTLQALAYPFFVVDGTVQGSVDVQNIIDDLGK